MYIFDLKECIYIYIYIYIYFTLSIRICILVHNNVRKLNLHSSCIIVYTLIDFYLTMLIIKEALLITKMKKYFTKKDLIYKISNYFEINT